MLPFTRQRRENREANNLHHYRREVLRIQGECAYRVPPLDVPLAETEADQILGHSAPELFITRASQTYLKFFYSAPVI